MANQEHLNILSQGVDAWNRWRLTHNEQIPDLSRADLSDANLNEADLPAHRDELTRRESVWVQCSRRVCLECSIRRG